MTYEGKADLADFSGGTIMISAWENACVLVERFYCVIRACGLGSSVLLFLDFCRSQGKA